MVLQSVAALNTVQLRATLNVFLVQGFHLFVPTIQRLVNNTLPKHLCCLVLFIINIITFFKRKYQGYIKFLYSWPSSYDSTGHLHQNPFKINPYLLEALHSMQCCYTSPKKGNNNIRTSDM